MDFSFSREQEMLRNMVRDFAGKEVAPQVLQLNRDGELPRTLVKRMAELGLIGVLTPKEFGGTEMGHVAKMIITEELSTVYAPLGFFYEGIDGPIYLLQTAGTPVQRDKYLKPLISGEKLSCYAVTEAGGGSDPASMQTTAELAGDEYVINGRKVFITLAGMADIAFFVAKDGDGFSTFVVERGTPGFEVGRREKIAGLRAIPVNELIFTNCRIPKENLIGEAGRGLHSALAIFSTVARPGVAGVALGIARGAYEAALKFARERNLYGKPIANLQAIQFALADMDVEVEAAKLMCYRLAWLLDQGKSGREIAREAARAKLCATETAVKVSLKAIQILGGYGTTEEQGVISRLNDAISLFPAAGTSEVMRITIGRDITR